MNREIKLHDREESIPKSPLPLVRKGKSGKRSSDNPQNGFLKADDLLNAFARHG